MSWKTRKLNRAELSIAFRDAWQRARYMRDECKRRVRGALVSCYPDIRENFRNCLKNTLIAMRRQALVWVGSAEDKARHDATERQFEIMQIEAKDFLNNEDRARLSELKSLPRAA